MATLSELLHDSHEIQRGLCRQLTAARRDIYVPIPMSDAGLSASRHALSEHHDIEELCEDLSVRELGHKVARIVFKRARPLLPPPDALKSA